MTNLLANCDRWSGTKKLIKDFNLQIGVEVGVREGFFSDHLLTECNIPILYGIEMKPLWNRINPLKQRYPDRFIFEEGKSPEIASKFQNDFFDFIYIDAGHSYDNVKSDLEAWWPKLKTNGFYMGDDFWNDKSDEDGIYGITIAVIEFVQKYNQDLYVSGINEGPNDFEAFKKWADRNVNRKTFSQNPQWYFQKK